MARKLHVCLVFIERYAYPRISTTVETPAHIVGALAVHRPHRWDEGDAPRPQKDGWTVTHIASGKSVAGAHARRCHGSTRAALITWAQAWQDACPEWFARLAETGSNVNPDAIDRELTLAAIDVAMRLSRA